MNIHKDHTVDQSDLFHYKQQTVLSPNGVTIIDNRGLWKKVGHRHYRIVLQAAGGSPNLCSTGTCEETPVNNLTLDDISLNRSKIVVDIHVSEDCETATGSWAAAIYDKDDMTFTGPSIPIPVATVTLQRFHLY